MKFKFLSLLILVIVFEFAIAKKNQFIEIQANKTLALFAFIDTANNSHSASHSFKKFIDNHLGDSTEFQQLISRFHLLKLDYQYELEGYPTSRYSYKNIKDLIWTAAANATDIDDLSERIVGYLPYEDYAELITVLKLTEPFYNKLVWNKTKKQTKRIVKQLTAYSDKIEELFLKISHFLGSTWSKQTPFKVMLYPIPLKQGHTTAIPKGNALIVGFLTENKQDYIYRLGIIVHEMVHILYGSQPVNLQNDIHKWFMQSESDYAKLTYNYIDEGLATAIGNGWVYQQIYGKMDTEDWYNNEYINGFAHEIYPSVSQHLNSNQILDEEFIQNSISSFEKIFPKAINETNILFNEIYLYADLEKTEKAQLQETLFNYFDVRSMWFYSPINDKESLDSMATKQATKVYVVANNNIETLKFLNKQFATLPKKQDTTSNFIYSLKDIASKSTVVIINIQSLDKLDQAIKLLSQEKYLKLGLQAIE